MELIALAERRETRLARKLHGESRAFNLAKSIGGVADGRQIRLLGSAGAKTDQGGRIILVEASQEGKRTLSSKFGSSVWVEEGIRHSPQSQSATSGSSRPFEIQVVGSGQKPSAGCHLTIFTQSQTGEAGVLSGDTDWDGRCTVDLSDQAHILKIVAVPRDGHWAAIANGPKEQIVCKAIEFPPDGLGWWHRALGFHAVAKDLGAGIKVGVIDSGCESHQALHHVHRIGTFGRNNFSPEHHASSPHGAHVCGIIGARKGIDPGFWGIAPGADIFVAAIAQGEYQWDMANAVKTLVGDHGVDLINISMGARLKSNILTDAIEDALDLGCLCICAAGNDGKDVRWPARSSEAIAVSAIGDRFGVVPGTYSAALVPPPQEGAPSSAEFALASFSCRGEDVDCCGPGVGIVSTFAKGLGEQGWWDMSGTSMAAPAVCATLAAFLAQSEEYAGLPRSDISRSSFARHALFDMCRSLELPRDHEGQGMPEFTKVVGPRLTRA